MSDYDLILSTPYVGSWEDWWQRRATAALSYTVCIQYRCHTDPEEAVLVDKRRERKKYYLRKREYTSNSGKQLELPELLK